MTNFTNGEVDDIEVRYEIRATFEVKGPEGSHTCADASFWISCGVYSGIPDKQTLADLITSRTIDPDDFEEIIGDLDADFMAHIISTRGVKPEEIRSMKIIEVLFQEETIAESIEEKADE